LVNKAAAV